MPSSKVMQRFMGVMTFCFALLLAGQLSRGSDEGKSYVLVNNFGAFCTMDVYVNDTKVGTLGKLDLTGAFSFVPNKNGKNYVYVKLLGYFSDSDSAKYTFDCNYGDSVAVLGTYSGTFGFTMSVRPIPKKADDATSGIGKPANNTLPPSEYVVLSVSLNPAVKQVVIKETPPIRVARRTEKMIEDSMTVLHSVTVTEGWKADTEVKGKVGVIWAGLEASIRAGIEKSTNRTYGVETTRKRSVTLRGDGTPGKIKVVWVECYRTGTALVKLDGKEVRIPFEFKEDFDLLTEEVD